MYVDTGNGWQFAKYAVGFDRNGRLVEPQRSSVTGLAPGARVPGVWSSSGSGGTADPGTNDPKPGTEQPPKSEWEIYLERELKRYEEEWHSGYVE